MARPLKQSGPLSEVLTPAPINPAHMTARQRANGAIPPSAKGTIKGMTSEALDAETAGSEGVPQLEATAPGSNRSIPAPYRDAIVTPAGFHVP